MKVLVAGAGGMLGRDLCAELADSGHTVDGPSHAELDICDAIALRTALAEKRPDWLVNCAAYTAVDACETDAAPAEAVNAVAPGLMARVCRESGVRLLHISTDYVFDGNSARAYTEEDPVAPVNAYGAGKLRGEQAVAAAGGQFLIVRTQWLFGAHGRNFVATILRLASAQNEVKVVNDQYGCPTYTADLARGLRRLMEARAEGVYHLAGTGSATWFDLATAAVEMAGLPAKVLPVNSSEFPRPARRPHYSALSTLKFERTTGWQMPDWRDSLKKYIAILMVKDQ